MPESNREYSSLQEALTALFGGDTRLSGKRPVSGGDINRAYLLTTSGGENCFLKENDAVSADFFLKEAQGLEALRKTGAIGVPKVLAIGRDGPDAFLLMEYLSQGQRIRDYYEDFGRNLAAMHGAECSAYTVPGRFGFADDNYIGAGYQENAPEEYWIPFFCKKRLLPQITRAEAYFDPVGRNKLERLLEKVPAILVEPLKPALLHGDLWSGNHMVGPDGRAWLIDPAVYVGHPEADLAMTQLFGSLPAAFYGAYFEAAGKQDGYEDRRDLYNLYHLLNHLNLFGGAYYGSVMSIVDRYV